MTLRQRGLIVGLLLFAAGVVHVWYWYLPRERDATPSPSQLPLQLLGDSSFAFRLWVPFPHQNLGALSAAVGESREYLDAVSRLAGGPSGWLPAFGPFSVPPAREMTAAYGSANRLAVVADVYPVMAVVGKMAGRVAANPWLRGGEVRLAEGRGRVRWQGRYWILESEGLARLSYGPEVGLERPGAALAAVGIADPPAPWVGGIYALQRTSLGIELRVGGSESGSSSGDSPMFSTSLLTGDTFLVCISGPGGPLGEEPSALAFQRVVAGQRGELPSAAVLFPAQAAEPRRFQLPGERMSRLGVVLYEERIGEWNVLALDYRGVSAARRLEPGLGPLLSRSAEASSTGLAFGLWFEPASLIDFAEALRMTLEELPLISRREVERWRDVERVLGPVRELSQISIESNRGGFWLRLIEARR